MWERKKCWWATFNTKQVHWGEVRTRQQLRSHCTGGLDAVFITVYPFKTGPVVKAVNGLWWANDSYVPRQALEYSATVNSFIESEALTPLKAAEHPRLKVNTKQRCLCSLPLYVSQKRKTGSTCCTHEAQFQYIHLYKAAPCLCSVSLTHFLSLGFLMPELYHHKWIPL